MSEMHAVTGEAWDGAFNVWDLGGLRLAGGGLTASARLYRSGGTNGISEAGWSAAAGAGVGTVVDLRNDGERGVARATPGPGIEVLNRPIEDQHDDVFMTEAGEWLSHPRSYGPTLDRFPDLIGAALGALAEAPAGAVYHCSAGRDRTGLISALVLELNGVEREVVLDDYRRGVRACNAHLLAGGSVGREVARQPEEVEGLLGERVEVLAALLDELDVADYLVGRTGMTEGAVEALAGRLRPDEDA